MPLLPFLRDCRPAFAGCAVGRACLAACCIALFSSSLHPAWLRADDEWPQFRGPDGQGHTAAASLPLTWSESQNVTWKTPIPGEGHSSPVISGDQIWLTTAITRPLSPEEEKQRLSTRKNPGELKLVGSLSLQAVLVDRNSGQLLQQIPLFDVADPEPKHALNSYASPTPVIAGDHVYFHFGTYGTACLDRRTQAVVWKNSEFHIDHQNGPGSSPVVWQHLLIIHFDGTDAQFIAAFDRMSGKVVWQTPRSGQMDPTPELQKAYGTPLIVETADAPLVISPAANWVYGYDARDGHEIWKAGYGQLGFSTVPRPVVRDNTVYVATSYVQSRLLAVRFDGRGDVTASHVDWMSDRQIPKKPSLLIMGDRLYFVSDAGILRCVNAKDGQEIWVERIGGDHSASPLAAAGRLYFFSQQGVATVIEDSDQYRELARNTLDGQFMASPAVAGNALFLRTDSHLYRIEQSSAAAGAAAPGGAASK